jgi:transcriptional regulator GlxA family with amidase domain
MDSRVNRVIAMMATVQDEIHLNEVAEEMNISYSRLRHIFKNETGLSPLQYLKAERIKHACVLLKTTYLSVKEIMSKVGIKDKSNFTRTFKAVYGLSPAQYRRQYFADRFNTQADSHIDQ